VGGRTGSRDILVQSFAETMAGMRIESRLYSVVLAQLLAAMWAGRKIGNLGVVVQSMETWEGGMIESRGVLVQALA